ncbi:MAG: T9SS type A sorting domain-containing protein [Bacteroidota bacterium]
MYDGFQFEWVREEIDLDNYVNQNILLRFLLLSDNWIEHDGFFFDDLKVEKILAANSVNEIGNEIQFSVSPNPTDGKFQVAIGNLQFAKIQIMDVLGNIIMSSVIGHQSSVVDLSGTPRGIYFVKVLDTNGNFGVKKIIIQ